jgi:hypothetical protein
MIETLTGSGKFWTNCFTIGMLLGIYAGAVYGEGSCQSCYEDLVGGHCPNNGTDSKRCPPANQRCNMINVNQATGKCVRAYNKRCCAKYCIGKCASDNMTTCYSATSGCQADTDPCPPP